MVSVGVFDYIRRSRSGKIDTDKRLEVLHNINSTSVRPHVKVSYLQYHDSMHPVTSISHLELSYYTQN